MPCDIEHPYCYLCGRCGMHRFTRHSVGESVWFTYILRGELIGTSGRKAPPCKGKQ